MNGHPIQVDTPANSILIDPDFPADVYLATDIGVFVSGDKGSTWQPYGVGLPRTAVLELKIDAHRKIVAATHGRGAWTIPALFHPGNRR
jgi:ligand-binding sensor domain-containing protein